MRFVFDTDHISIYQRRAGLDYARLSRRVEQQGPDEVVYSIISFHEQVIGCHAYINNARSPDQLVRGYSMLTRVFETFAAGQILPFAPAAAPIFADLISRRLKIGTMDLRIAAIALARDLTLVTRNVVDFGRVAELRTEDWTR